MIHEKHKALMRLVWDTPQTYRRRRRLLARRASRYAGSWRTCPWNYRDLDEILADYEAYISEGYADGAQASP